MSVVTRWEPLKGYWNSWKDVQEMEQRLVSFLRQPAPIEDDHDAMTVAEWTPLVDISEDEMEYLVKAELPEIKKEDVKVTVLNNVLCISGERKPEPLKEGRKYHRMERAYGSFIRTFSLPENTDATKVTAEYKDGILAIHVPKSEKVQLPFMSMRAA